MTIENNVLEVLVEGFVSLILARGVHHSGYCNRIPVTPALPPIVLRYDIPPIGAIILFRGLPITEAEPEPENQNQI